MSFIKFLHGIGDRFGILEAGPVSETVPEKQITTRVVSLKELAGEIRSGEVRALADSPAELAITFEQIYAAAGIASKPEDWTIDKLQEAVSEETSGKSREDAQKALLERLQSNGVSSEALIRDAIARDQALDEFEGRVAEKMRGRSEACKKKILDLETQVKKLQEEAARIADSLAADEEKWREWKRRKRSHERELAAALSYIVDRSVITTDDGD